MCKNHKHSYTPITDREPDQEWTAIHNCYKENKIRRNTTNKGCKGPQGNKKGHKQMEKHSMLMVKKNQYCENGHSAQSNLWIQYHPHQATCNPLHITGQNHLKLNMEPKESPHSQDYFKQKEQSWIHHTTWLQTILQGYGNQNSMVLVPKQRYKPMEQNRGLKGNTSHLQPSDLWQTWEK